MSGVPSVTVINETPTVTVGDTQPDATIVAPTPFRPTRYSIEDYRSLGMTTDQVIANIVSVQTEDADLAYATNAGATIVGRDATTYELYDQHIIPSHINIVGENVTGTVFKRMTATSGLYFQDPDAASPQASSNQYGGMSGNFTIDNNGQTGPGMVVGKGNNRVFLPIHSLNGGGDGIQVYGAQNPTFIAPVTTGNAGYGMRFDYGTAGALVLGGNHYDNAAGNIGFTAQGGYQHSPPLTPETTPQSQVTFVKTVIERPNSLAGTLIDVQAGKRIQFLSCPISAGGATSDLSLVKVRRPNTDLSTTHIQFTDCTLIGRRYTGTSPDTAKVTHFDIDDGANVILDGTTQFTSGYLAYSIGDTASVVANGDVIGLDTVGTYQVASNATIATTVAGDATHNEVQTVTLNGSPNAGTLTLTFPQGTPQTTSGLAYNASAATIQTALQALSNIGSGNVAVTGGPWPAMVTLTFQGALANTNVAQITADTSGLLVKNRFDNKGGTHTEDQQIQGHRSHPILIERLNTTDRALILKAVAEVFPRMHLRPDLISMGDGTANPDSPFYRGAVAKSLRFDTYIRQGDLDTIRGVSSGTSTLSNLPTASATYRDYAVWVQGDGSTVADELYVCRLMADGTYAWAPVRATPTAVWVAAGAFMNTSGATASQTTDGRTAIWQLPGGGASNIGGELYLPYWARGWNIDLYWLAKDGTVTSVTWEASIRLDKVVPPATPANTLVYGTTNISTNGLTLGDWQITRVVSAYTPTTAGVFNVRVVRTNGAGNTYAGNIGVVGLLATPV
jgi:hypothetical protein